MAPSDWHRRFSRSKPEFCEFAAALCDGHSSSGDVERAHKSYGLVHTRLRSNLTKQRLVQLVHVHHSLRLRVRIGEVGWCLPVLQWVHARDVAEQRKLRRDLAGGEEVEVGSFLDMMSTTYGMATSVGAPTAGV